MSSEQEKGEAAAAVRAAGAAAGGGAGVAEDAAGVAGAAEDAALADGAEGAAGAPDAAPSAFANIAPKPGNASKLGESAVKRTLSYRPPFLFQKLLGFFAARALAGVEVVDERSYARTVHLTLTSGEEARGWFRVEQHGERNALVLSMSESLLPAASVMEARVRRMFDLDCEPKTISAALAPLEEARAGVNVCGTRLPGSFDPFEISCRAVLGQQISVAAANKLAARIVETLGTPLDTGIDGLGRLWPTPAQFLALEDAAGTLGSLGVIRSRTAAIVQIARMVESGELRLDGQVDASEAMRTLLSIKGIGPWSANYIVMRALSYSDAFLEKDAGVAHALPDLTPKERLLAAEPCRPWRSYAVISLWNSLSS